MSPPVSWSDLAGLLGEEGAIRIVRALGGLQLTVPRNTDPRNRLLRELPDDLARRLVESWGGCQVYIPEMSSIRRERRNARIRERRASGETVREIALSEGLSARQVNNVLKAMRESSVAVPEGVAGGSVGGCGLGGSRRGEP